VTDCDSALVPDRRFRAHDYQLSVGQWHVQIVQLGGSWLPPQSVSDGTVIYALRSCK